MSQPKTGSPHKTVHEEAPQHRPIWRFRTQKSIFTVWETAPCDLKQPEWMLDQHDRMNSIKIPHVSMWQWNQRWSNDIYLSGTSSTVDRCGKEKVNKNKSWTGVSSCKGCIRYLSSFVFLLPSLPVPLLTFQVLVTQKGLKMCLRLETCIGW